MGHHPDLLREMAARHSRGTSRVGRFSACEKLVIRRPKRSWRAGRPTTRWEYQASKGPIVSEVEAFWSLFSLGRVQGLQPPRSPRVLVSRQRSIIITRACRALYDGLKLEPEF
jgi:hypothetical protein